MLGFTQPHSGPLNDPSKRCAQLIAGTYINEKPNKITGIDETHLKEVVLMDLL